MRVGWTQLALRLDCLEIKLEFGLETVEGP